VVDVQALCQFSDGDVIHVRQARAAGHQRRHAPQGRLLGACHPQPVLLLPAFGDITRTAEQHPVIEDHVPFQPSHPAVTAQASVLELRGAVGSRHGRERGRRDLPIIGVDELDQWTGRQFRGRVPERSLESGIDPGHALGVADEQQIRGDGEETFQLAAAGFQLGGHAFAVARGGQQCLQRRHHPMRPPHGRRGQTLGNQQSAGLVRTVEQRDGQLLIAGRGVSDGQRRPVQPEYIGEAPAGVLERGAQSGRTQHDSCQVGGQVCLAAPLLSFGGTQTRLADKRIGEECQCEEDRQRGSETVLTLEMEVGVHGGAGQ
jgi:hypothetical protein